MLCLGKTSLLLSFTSGDFKESSRPTVGQPAPHIIHLSIAPACLLSSASSKANTDWSIHCLPSLSPSQAST